MKIVFTKLNPSTHRITVFREGELADQATLNSCTFFLHDIVHYCVETELQIKNGFWGMINQGYYFQQLIGKTNELTGTLRYVEQIAGPVQSVFSGHMPAYLFQETMDNIGLPTDCNHFLEDVLFRIEHILNEWKFLPIGQSLELKFCITAESALSLPHL